jgi:predicted nucleic acid-binding protein
MKRYVVDASVILKWVVGNERESDHEKAKSLLETWTEGNIELSSPMLWQYEVGNFLGRSLQDEAIDKMNLLLNLNIRNVALTNNMVNRCFSWMRQKKITFYDASYLAVAFEVQGTLITADEKFAEEMEKTNLICLLKNLDPGA